MRAVSALKAALQSDRRSLRWKLPWLFALSAALTVAAFGIFAYGSVRSLALDAATTRLQSALSQIRTITELGVVNQLSSLRVAANNPAIIAALRSDRRISDSAVAALQVLKGVSDSSVVVELIDSTEKLRYALPPTAGLPGEPRQLDVPAFAAVGPLYQRDGNVFFESTVSVSASGGVVGWIRVVRQQRHGVNANIAARLVEGAVLLNGNRDGAMWSESGAARYPFAPGNAGERYLRHGERWLSVSAPIRDAPWVYAVELPERIALAPANALVIPFLVTGLLIAILGALLGERVSRRITAPLGDLMTATEAIARGDRSVPLVAIERADEIGRLARAFQTMANSVASARERLEAEVDARTGELTSVSGRLRVLHAELEKSEKFATLGRLSGNVGHELRNPLGVMSNIAYLLDTLPDASDKLKDYARVLREQVRVSDRIISDLLDRARTGAAVRSAVNVTSLLAAIVKRAAIPDSIRVEQKYAIPLPCVVLDRDHLAQILWNLMTNAVQAMNGVGTLTIAATYGEGRLRIEVRDSGTGIPSADVERIFEPMYTTKAHGNGLGLSISRAFARSSGGDLFVEPTASGACFVVDLPAPLAPEEPLDDLAVMDFDSLLTMVERTPIRVHSDTPPRLESV